MKVALPTPIHHLRLPVRPASKQTTPSKYCLRNCSGVGLILMTLSGHILCLEIEYQLLTLRKLIAFPHILPGTQPASHPPRAWRCATVSSPAGGTGGTAGWCQGSECGRETSSGHGGSVLPCNLFAAFVLYCSVYSLCLQGGDRKPRLCVSALSIRAGIKYDRISHSAKWPPSR